MTSKEKKQRKVSEFTTAAEGQQQAARVSGGSGRGAEGAGVATTSGSDLARVLEELKGMRADFAAQLGTMAVTLDMVRARIDGVVERTGEVERRVGEAEDVLARMDPAVTRHETEMQKLQAALEEQESRSRRSNIRVVGIPESKLQQRMAEEMEKLIPILLPEARLSAFFVIERAHRALGRPPAPGQPPRAIIMKILNFRDRDEILMAARKKGEIVWEGHRISFYPDLTAATQKARKRFDTVKRELRNRGLDYAMMHPAKLRIVVRGKVQFFEDPQKAWQFLEAMPAGNRGTVQPDDEAAVE